jgi:hypothetical protein
MIISNLNIVNSIKQQSVLPIRYPIPATVYVMGAGGAGGDTSGPDKAGGGGGAGANVSSSILLTPNITHTIVVGNAVTSSNGETSNFFGYDGGDGYNRPVTISAQGGRQGVSATVANEGGAGGNSGSGSIIFPEVVINYPAFTGGSPVTILPSRQAGGGGAAATGNGGNASSGGPGAIGGNGASGSAFPTVTLGISGGGGGGGANTNAGMTPGDGGLSRGLGSGGQGADGVIGGELGDVGGAGSVVVLIDVADNFDVTTTNVAAQGILAGSTYFYRFNTGSGTIRFTRPFPYNPQP